MLEGIAEVLKILANKISRKAAVITIAMFLVYMLSSTPTASYVVFCVVTVSLLSVIFTFIQYIIDKKVAENRIKGLEEPEEPEKIEIVLPEVPEKIEDTDGSCDK